MRATLETLSTKTQEFVYLGGAVGIAICRAIIGNVVPRQVHDDRHLFGQHRRPHRPHDGRIDGLAMSRREDETWKIVGVFVIVCALLTALMIVVL